MIRPPLSQFVIPEVCDRALSSIHEALTISGSSCLIVHAAFSLMSYLTQYTNILWLVSRPGDYSLTGFCESYQLEVLMFIF